MITQSNRNIDDLIELVELLDEKLDMLAASINKCSSEDIYDKLHLELDEKITQKIEEAKNHNTQIIHR